MLQNLEHEDEIEGKLRVRKCVRADVAAHHLEPAFGKPLAGNVVELNSHQAISPKESWADLLEKVAEAGANFNATHVRGIQPLKCIDGKRKLPLIPRVVGVGIGKVVELPVTRHKGLRKTQPAVAAAHHLAPRSGPK